MKTFNEILTEIIHEDHVYENETTVAPEERAAKEYAKQWVDHCERNSFMPKIIAENIKRQVDEHS